MESHVRRNSRNTVFARGTRADDPGDVSSVAVAVVRIGIGGCRRVVTRARRVRLVGVTDKVEALLDPAAGAEAASEIRMLVIDAAVDDGDSDTRTRVPEVVGDIRTGLCKCRIELGADRSLLRIDLRHLHRVNRTHSAKRGQYAGMLRVDADRHAVPQRAEGKAFLILQSDACGLSSKSVSLPF